MSKFVWFSMFFAGFSALLLRSGGDAVLAALVDGAGQAVTLGISLAGAYMLWTGLLNVARRAGLMDSLAKRLRPVIRWLFPGVGREAAGAITLNLSANMLGLGSAATPFGLSAMRYMAADNPQKGRATHAMCMFLCINASAVQLLPTSMLSLRAACGSLAPAAVILPGLFASAVSTAAAILLCRFLSRRA